MGAIAGLTGTSGGAAGTGFHAPAQAAALSPTTNANQVAGSYAGAQNSLYSQQQLLNALGNQRGLEQQSNVTGYEDALGLQQRGVGNVANQASALNSQFGFNNQMAGLQGAANQQNVFNQGQQLAGQMNGAGGVSNLSGALASQQGLAAQQQATANQYQNIANGTGPNPAQAALNQSTGQNIASQAALMAGQRGAGANVGLMARQAAQQGASTQQQAVGQAATMQAQQQLAGLSGLQAQQQAIGQTNSNVSNIAAQQIAQQQAQQQALAGQAQAEVSQQQAGINAAQQAATNMTAQQMAQQQALAGQVNTVAGQQIAQTNAGAQSQLQQQAAQQQAAQAMNSNQVGMQTNINTANAGLASTQMQGQQGLLGGVLGGVGSALGLAKGGDVKHMANGGPTNIPMPASSAVPSLVQAPQAVPPPGPSSSFGKFLTGFGDTMQSQKQGSPLQQGTNAFASGLVNKLKNKPMAPQSIGASAGDDVSNTANTTDMMAAMGGSAKRHDYRSGGHVKAKNDKEKAVKSGDSYANDKIPALLSEHEIVIPRHITQGEDPVKGSADFVAKVLAKRKRA